MFLGKSPVKEAGKRRGLPVSAISTHCASSRKMGLPSRKIACVNTMLAFAIPPALV